MQKMIFKVETGQQSPRINKLLKCADLADCALVDDGSGFIITITWKIGEIIDAKRIAKTKENLKKAFENLGFCVLGITKRSN